MDVANQAQRKMLIDTFVNAIFLYDDKVVLTYNFHEGTETISFEELQKVTEAGASGSDLVSSTAPNENFRENGSFYLLQRNIKAKTGLEEAVVNQATVWPESGADRAAASRENPVLFPAPQKKARQSVGLLFVNSGNGLEEAVMNQAPVGLENGADRAATSRENPVLFPAPNQYNPNQIFQIGNRFGFFSYLLITKV